MKASGMENVAYPHCTSTGDTMKDKKEKKFIFFCDDKDIWTKRFGLLHGNGRDYAKKELEILKEKNELPSGQIRTINGRIAEEFNGDGEFRVLTINRSMDFKPVLEGLLRLGERPDVILIDLYHPKSGVAQDVINTGEDAIKKLRQDIRDARKPIEAAWVAEGFKLLEQARTMLKDAGNPNTPVAIYTEQGLTLASEEEHTGESLERVSRQDGEWFIKGQTGIYESEKLRTMLVGAAKRDDEISTIKGVADQATQQIDACAMRVKEVADELTKRNANITRYAFWTLGGVIMIAPLICSYALGRHVDYLPSFIGFLSALALPFIIPFFVQKKE